MRCSGRATVVRQGRGSARRLATDDGALGSLLADALPHRGRQAAGGSTTVERSPKRPRLVVHVNPLAGDGHRLDFAVRVPAVLVLIVDPGDESSVDADLVAATFRLTRSESRIAAALAEGRSVREIARRTWREESSVRWHVKRIHTKLGISRQAELVRLVLAATGAPTANRTSSSPPNSNEEQDAAGLGRVIERRASTAPREVRRLPLRTW